MSTQACRNQLGSRGSPNVSRLSALEDRLPSCRGPCQMTRKGAIKGSPPAARVVSRSGPSRLWPRRREGGSITTSARSALTSSGRRLSTHRLMSRRSRRLALSARNTTRPSFARTGHSGVSPIQPVSGGLIVTGGRESEAMSSVYPGMCGRARRRFGRGKTETGGGNRGSQIPNAENWRVLQARAS